MRFTSRRDYNTMLSFNKELVNRVIDTNVIIYKLNSQESKTNVYGESTSKARYTPIQVPCLIDRILTTVDTDTGKIDIRQEVQFAFLRKELALREVYPQVGDIVFFDMQYYEINNVNENQLYAGQESYNHNILCDAHLTRRTPLDIEEDIL